MAKRGFYIVREHDGFRLASFFLVREEAQKHAEYMFTVTGRTYFVLDGVL